MIILLTIQPIKPIIFQLPHLLYDLQIKTASIGRQEPQPAGTIKCQILPRKFGENPCMGVGCGTPTNFKIQKY